MNKQNKEINQKDIIPLDKYSQNRKNLRKEGKIPGVYYSHDSKESIAFCIDENELSKAEKSISLCGLWPLRTKE